MSYRRETIRGADCDLSVVTTGPEHGQPIVLLHGMRDHALSMQFVQDSLPDHRLIMPDLRGHGDSDKTSQYSFLLSIADIKAVFDQYVSEEAVLVGHSLGGHFSTRFTAIYPEKVSRLVLLDGMGPPRAMENSIKRDEGWLQEWRDLVDQQLSKTGGRKIMKDHDEAYARFRRNNPLIAEDRLKMLVDNGITEHGGGVVWKWDTAVDSIWSSFSEEDSEAMMQLIQCPTLIVTGDRSLDYWAAHRESLRGADEYYQQELNRRAALFRDARSEVLPGAGHMLHYDNPGQLAELIANFVNG